MNEVILNEESLPFESIRQVKNNLPTFFAIIREFSQYKINEIRVSENFSTGWYGNRITQDYYFRDYFEYLKVDSGIVKGIIEKTVTPQIEKGYFEDESKKVNFFLKKQKVVSLGNAYLLSKYSLSFLSKEIWYKDEVTFKKQLIKNDKLTEEYASAKNISTLENWHCCKEVIELEWKESSRKGVALLKNTAEYFPNLVFCKELRKQIKDLSIGTAMYNCLWSNLKALNFAIEQSTNLDKFRNTLQKDYSDESDKTKKNPKLNRRRKYTLPTGEKKFFYLHIKNFPCNHRLHFLPDFNIQKVYVGYFGTHLPT